MSSEVLRHTPAEVKVSFPDQAETFLSREGYTVEFGSERWRLSKDIDLPIGTFCDTFPGNASVFRHVLAFYARHSSPSHAKNLMERVAHYVRQLNGAELFSVESLISYRASLDRNREWYLSTVRVFLKQWSRLGYSGIPDESLTLLEDLVIKGNEKGRAVQSMCPDEGPLTDIEMQGVVEASTHAFAQKRLSLSDTCLVMTLAMTGRRPAQISALKIKDLIPGEGKYWIDFPRAKQRGMKWRSTFKRFAIVEDLWLLLNQQADDVTKLFCKLLKVKSLSPEQRLELPLFPNINEHLSASDIQALLSSDQLHIPSHDVTVIVREAAETIGVISERTGFPLHLNPNRFRYTLGTNLAREGHGEYVIAQALDHTDTQNAGVYVRNIPEIVERIGKAVAMQLAPIAQAFRGVLVLSETDARRGSDPSSRISNGQGNVGSCGSYGFCNALAPIACYTCAFFQPWVDGPHEEVLESLITQRDRVRDLTGDLKVASTNDRLILAVCDVIRRCQVAKEVIARG
jgi:integrase